MGPGRSSFRQFRQLKRFSIFSWAIPRTAIPFTGLCNLNSDDLSDDGNEMNEQHFAGAAVPLICFVCMMGSRWCEWHTTNVRIPNVTEGSVLWVCSNVQLDITTMTGLLVLWFQLCSCLPLFISLFLPIFVGTSTPTAPIDTIVMVCVCVHSRANVADDGDYTMRSGHI